MSLINVQEKYLLITLCLSIEIYKKQLSLILRVYLINIFVLKYINSKKSKIKLNNYTKVLLLNNSVSINQSNILNKKLILKNMHLNQNFKPL